jgi:hypothetical protein
MSLPMQPDDLKKENNAILPAIVQSGLLVIVKHSDNPRGSCVVKKVVGQWKGSPHETEKIVR